MAHHGSTNPNATAEVAFDIHIPKERVDQDGEWCRVRIGGRSETIRFHDYARIYDVPGLYEALFRDRLGCQSPEVVTGLLADRLEAAGVPPSELRCLDVGAGNGMVGAALRSHGIEQVVGIDILPEAARAALRDRPRVYRDYVVGDLTALSTDEQDRLTAVTPNALTLVAALGYGDIPAEAFLSAWSLVTPDAWIAINIKDRFLEAQRDLSGFAGLMRGLIEDGHFAVETQHRYVHRRSTSGDPLHYVALIGRKRDAGPLAAV